MGIINSLIVPNSYKDELMDITLKDKYLFVENGYLFCEKDNAHKSSYIIEDEKKRNNLSAFLKMEEGEFNKLYKKELEVRLHNISIEECGSTYLIKQKLNDIDNIKLQISSIEENLKSLEEKMAILKKEYEVFPSVQDLKTNLELIEEKEDEVKRKSKELLLLEEKYLKLNKSLEQAKIKVFEKTSEINIEKNSKSFEETLINTISTKITAKIYQTKIWVDQMNDLMEAMNTSSGLKFSLKWIPRKADNENQMDISSLVNILQRGAIVTEEDIDKLSKHFKEMLKQQKRDIEASGEIINYQSIIKDILDYRQWYEFRLYFTKPSKGKKELTDNEFFKFSGGEKAMAMYVPLFAAVNAKYNGADKKDCPRIIALDEAFAGVDENNISDMFKLLERMDLDYVLNSQVLWGDYATVKELAICELTRDKEDDIVVVERFQWNGKEKVIVLEGEEVG